MAGVASGGSGDTRPYDGSGQEGGAAGEALAEWRSSEQLENGTPSTSPPLWDTDDDDEDCGLRPSELYGKYTWKIDKFSQINKRELRSNEFEVGGYKWYILIYPQGCDVCNHLSLFLCVADHDKLLPGWSHFAQFTIAVVNKDPKKSKYSDTLHRFWKKEHDWGWKKFMELSKVMDGFIDADTLIIKAQVQVIREKADRPFRCLDCLYRRELVRVYLTNVEQICRRYVEEKRSKLGKLIEDKARWSSFCAFWLEIDQKSRCGMIRERTDSILRAVVKQFFIEKEVTSTLVMDSLYSGLKALEGKIKNKNDRCKLFGTEEPPIPVVRVDQDMFILVDDVLLLLERAALEPLPPKDDKGPQNRMKDGGFGDDFSKESIERDERRLTELGRRTIEIFVLAYIFSKIEVAYQEVVALKRQEELIREEAAWLETEQKSKRGAEKEKKSKKKQGKQKRNNRKGKDKGRDENTIANALDKLQLEGPDESKDSVAEESKPELEKLEIFEDVSDASDTVDHDSEVLHPDSEERESSPLNWDIDTSEILPLTEASGGGVIPLSAVQNGIRESNGSCTAVDDSSSTCSTDSVPFVVMNGSYKASNPLPNHENHRSPTRERKLRGRATSDLSGWIGEGNTPPSYARRDAGPQNGLSGSSKAESEPEAATESLHDKMKKVLPRLQDVKGQVICHREPSNKDRADTRRPLKEKITVAPSSPISSSKIIHPIQPKLEPKIIAPAAKISIKRPLSDTPRLASSVTNSADVAAASRSELHISLSTPKPTEKPLTQEVPVTSRPFSAPTVPGPRPTTPVVSMVQTQPFLSRSVSAVGRLGPDHSAVTHHHLSYRNAMMGTSILTPPTSTSSGYTQPISPSTSLTLLQPHPQPANLVYPSMFPHQSSEFGMVNHSSMQNDVHALDLFKHVNSRTHDSFPSVSPACTSSRQSHGLLTDEFPHLDIINDLLDDESGTGNIATVMSTSFRSFDSGPQHLHRQFSFPEDIAMGTSTSFQSFDSGPQHHHCQFSYPEDIAMTNDMLVGTSTSSCRFERSRSYQENGFQPSYNSFGAPFESTLDFLPQPHLRPFQNGQIEGLVPNKWHVPGSDLSYLSTRTSDGGGYPYHIPDYSNSYPVFRPSNGQ